MNVNLTPSVDTPKVTNVTKSGTASDSVTSDSGETKGFLDKLASLLLGSKGDGDATQADAGSSSKLLADSEVQATDGESIKSSSTDALLAQDGVEPDDAESVDAEAITSNKVSADSDDANTVKIAQSDEADIPENLKPFIATDEDEQVKLKAKTAQAMDDGDKILGRLQEANQTLVKKDGKPLPHQPQMTGEAQPVDLPVKENLTDTTVNPTAVKLTSEEELIADQSLQDKHTLPTSQAAASFSGVVAEDVEQLPDDHPLKQAKNVKNVQALSDHEIATMLAKQSPQAKQLSQQSVQPVDEKALDDQLAPSVAAAIPWASNTTIDNTVLDADGKMAAKPMQQGVVAQPVHQALQTQHLATQADKAMAAQSAMPAAVSTEAAAQAQLHPAANLHANPMLSAAMMTQADPTVSQAALKAGLGAKALAGLAGGKQKGQPADSHLAQQLSAAAGQQGVTGAQSLRADNLQAAQSSTSTPLHLARSDMAADEVAERVQVMLSKNLKNIDIRLDPPELGRMHIRMNMNSDGATVHFTVANQQARDALEQSMPRLREMLNNQGVQLGDTSVQQQNSGQQQRYAAGGDGSGGQSASGDHMNSDENLDTNVKLDLNVAAKRDGISYYA